MPIGSATRLQPCGAEGKPRPRPSASAALAACERPDAATYLQLAGYYFHCFKFDQAAALLDRAMDHFPIA